MKSSEIRELSLKELEERLENEETMLVRMKMNHAVSPLDNPNKIVETRRNVARLKTEMRARQIQVQSEKQYKA
jgi:large subunit ribosomal protein L29